MSKDFHSQINLKTPATESGHAVRKQEFDEFTQTTDTALGGKVSTDGSAQQLLAMNYADWEQLAEKPKNAVVSIADHPADSETGGAPTGNVVKTYAQFVDPFTLTYLYLGDVSALETLDTDFGVIMVLLATLEESQVGVNTGVDAELLQELVQAFEKAGVTSVIFAGIDDATGTYVEAILSNITYTSHETDLNLIEIAGIYTVPRIGRNIPTNSFMTDIYSDGSTAFIDAKFLGMSGGSFQSRWEINSVNEVVQAGQTLNLGLFNMSSTTYGLNETIELDYNTGVFKFPKMLGFSPYQVDVRLTGTIGGTGSAGVDFSIDMVRAVDDSVPTSFVGTRSQGASLNNMSLGGQTWTNGVDDPYSEDGVMLVFNNNYARSEDVTLTGVVITITGQRS